MQIINTIINNTISLVVMGISLRILVDTIYLLCVIVGLQTLRHDMVKQLIAYRVINGYFNPNNALVVRQNWYELLAMPMYRIIWGMLKEVLLLFMPLGMISGLALLSISNIAYGNIAFAVIVGLVAIDIGVHYIIYIPVLVREKNMYQADEIIRRRNQLIHDIDTLNRYTIIAVAIFLTLVYYYLNTH